jgi:tetratricopeptide (TPR) repeat protein
MASIEQLQQQIQRFSAFLKVDPDNRSLLLEMGELYHRAGQYDDALAYLVRLLELEPGSVVAQSRIASVYLSQHRFAEASTILQALAASGERSAALEHNLGIALFFQERHEEAAVRFAAARDAGLDTPTNAKFLAYCLHHEGNLEGASAACEAWIAGDAGPAGRAYLSLLSFDAGDRERARDLALQVLADVPDNPDANAVAGSLALEDQDIDSANAHFTTVLAQQPDNGRALLGYGLTLLHREDHAGAVAALTRASDEMPGNAGTDVALGWTLLTGGDAAAAEIRFRIAIEHDRGFAEAHGGLASALVHLGRLDEARQAIAVASKLDRNNFGSVYAQAALLKLEQRSDLADRLIARALERAPVAGGPTLLEGLNKLLVPRVKH